ncbi:hypothetical protein FBU30_001986 [Linnemannia zychae]|nr:hypothetical protein FBU30_001986 [Linnemannia zychae]
MSFTILGEEPPSHGGFGSVLSYIIGWAYFLAWSASFYPQALLNYRRKAVQGLSLDFVHLNVFGFLCYSIFNVAFFFSTEIQEEYKRRNDGQENLVRANDVFFAVHALILSTVTLVQTWVYKRDEGQRISLFAWVFLLVSSVATLFLIAARSIFETGYEWIDILYFLSYIKLVISFVKYCPQVWINYVAKSTVGWSIHNILLDFTGGVLSIAQLILDAYISDDWSGISGDPVKFGLGFLSIAFDVVFILQHYVLYRNRTDRFAQQLSEDRNNAGDGERQRLLASSGKYIKPDGRDLENAELEEARKTRKEEWEKAYANNENPPPIQEEIPYDPRTLYERLQEQKQKKNDAFIEATKFGNLIHKIDNDEYDFLSSLEDEETKKKREQAEQEEEALKTFRMNVQSKSTTVAVPLLDPVGESSSSSIAKKPTYFTSMTSGSAKKKKSMFAGLVAKPDSKDETTTTINTTVVTETTNNKTIGKRKQEESNDNDDEKKEAETKKAKTDAVAGTEASANAKPKSLPGLVAYDSSSDDEDE